MLWAAISKGGDQLISFVVFAILARLLGPEVWGLIAIATVFISFLAIFQDQGMSMALIQKSEIEDKHIDTAFLSNILVGLLLLIICQLIAHPVASIYSQPQLEMAIRLLSLSILTTSLGSVHNALLQRNLRFKALAARNLIANSIGGGVAIIMAYRGFGLYSIVAQRLVSTTLQTLMLWRFSQWRPSFQWSTTHFNELFGFGMNILGIKFLDFINRQSDSLLIGFFLGPVALGFYNIAYRMMTLLRELTSEFSKPVAYSMLSAMQQDIPKLRNAYYTLMKFAAVIVIPVFLGVIVLADDVIIGLFGSQWTDSVKVLQILCLVGLFESVMQVNGSVLMSVGKPNLVLRIMLINATINLIAFTIAAQFSIEAVATAFVTRALLLSPLPLRAVKRLIQIDYMILLKELKMIVLSGFIMMAAVFIVIQTLPGSRSNIASILVGVLIGATTYAVSLNFLEPSLLSRVKSILANRHK